MSAIAKYLEAAKKATAGPWRVHVRDSSHIEIHNDNTTVVDAWAEYAYDAGVAIEMQDAEFIASARNAAKEIEELRDFVRHFIRIHDAGMLDTATFTKLDRIREIVGGGE